MKRARLFIYFLFISLVFSLRLSADPSTCRLLVASPIRQSPLILKEFLSSLERLNKDSYIVDYYFIDDNVIEESRRLLREFMDRHKDNVTLISVADNLANEAYACNETTHQWKDAIIWKVAAFKDQMIQCAKDRQYDYLFLIDSDLVLHPQTIEQLISVNKDIVSNVYWTCWTPDSALLPQVWMQDNYSFFEKVDDKPLSAEDERIQHLEFIYKIRRPGTYEVGGLGACTLINKKALNQGISFKKVKNLSFWGEDRHFCVRAAALGLDLHVDTHYPAYHIYRESALCDVEDFKNSCLRDKRQTSQSKPRITLSMIMKNEASRYLKPVLEDAKRYITDAVIIDDASTDQSVEMCEEILKGIPLVIIRNSESKFSHESDLRLQQWKETVKTNPDWMVFLDADEIFEPAFANQVQNLISNETFDVYYFRLYDLWDDSHYREDAYWKAHQVYRPFLVRYRPDIPYQWNNQSAQHCGRLPGMVDKLIGALSSLRLKHYGWAKKEDREEKRLRYQTLDPDAKYGVKEQYDSILDENPTLIKWTE